MEKQDIKFNHLMIDIETMGNKSYSSILSIGALEFDLETGKTGESFVINIDLQSCLDIGLVINADTLMWWLNQSEDSRLQLINSKKYHISEALLKFSEFCSKNKYQVWGNSNRFDLGLLQNAYNILNLPLPWDFRLERDVRTLVSLYPNVKANFKYKGISHDALQDCYNQVEYCYKTLKMINSNYLSGVDKLYLEKKYL